ncbi:hypothetical protein Cgig2_021546 [Carnegiea gigantea]|uniref:Uncharacterized protein n=1 Tax=Carnegiea gigantea TaxID=171969 RepID=A0A9Q1JFQ2_9CARY|nr:hypothetical protein Cgig2_021546 [Carnegiea gigantea]
MSQVPPSKKSHGQGAYHTWTNKTIWSRLDRAFINTMWFELFNFTQILYKPIAILDHASMIVEMPGCPKPSKQYQFCDMWIRDPTFLDIIGSTLPHGRHKDPLTQLILFLSRTKSALQKLNKGKYVDLRHQQSKARHALSTIQQQMMEDPANEILHQQEKDLRGKYVSSVIDLI